MPLLMAMAMAMAMPTDDVKHFRFYRISHSNGVTLRAQISLFVVVQGKTIFFVAADIFLINGVKREILNGLLGVLHNFALEQGGGWVVIESRRSSKGF